MMVQSSRSAAFSLRSALLVALAVSGLAPSTASAAVGRTIGASDVSRLGEEAYSIPIVFRDWT